MSLTVRWFVGIAGLVFALTAFIPVTVSQHVWIALVLGAIVGVPGFVAAATRTSWLGALLTLAGLWMLASSFLGLVQSGFGHVALNLLTGAAVMALTVFVHEPAATRV